ncbi:hypothetical protein BJI69_20205 [Luteibacter rhizovicinus DSM 16549]|uniref:Uncharacterized protein n=1 Tax=Luteibacter rhizovicinus DSM 16549 TaxID=1440763 RepID=A0A0G9H287_9GAMM|nr:hypothetical protein [Luteibacter rhizovicinus]APG05994.1 hypothetical protein BJI69_20205 [Luteibacter rhizovicinus DSM 16549]KLD63970.1 hypothetical protein Y883_18460 [Luteibacter rhizovicinus DSM 16549]KLD76670.1 hypothetical protein Y886_20025 [Xanthomonas hyacinthi DSM 19077]
MSFIRWLDHWRKRPNAISAEQANLLEGILQWALESTGRLPGTDDRVLQARAVLLQLGPSVLLELDQRMRSWRRPRADDLPTDLLDRLARPDVDQGTREAGQFLVAMHWSGHLRERAVRELEANASRLALTASLIRSADWVNPVREAATDIADRLIDRCDEDDVFALMPLFFRLEGHSRFDRDRLHRTLEAWLTRNDERLVHALDSPYAPLRRWAFSILLARPEAIGHALLKRAINDPDPSIPVIAFRMLDDLPDTSRRELTAIALNAKHPIVRQLALRAMARVAPPVPVAVLHRALIDKSAGMRAFAAHTYRTQQHGDPADFWRSLVDAKKAPWSVVLSLAESAKPEDDGRLHDALRHPDGRVRAAALRALIKMGMTATDAQFIDFASDASPRVRRLLAEMCKKGDISLGAERLRLLWSAFPDITPAHASDLLNALTGGERLDLLLSFEPRSDVERRWWNSMLATWADGSLGWWKTAEPLRRQLLDLLARQSHALDAALVSRFEKSLVP